MGFLSRLAERLFKPVAERTQFASPNNAQPELARAVIVAKRGPAPPSDDEARAVFLATLDLVKGQDPIARRMLERYSLGSRSVGVVMTDAVEGPDIDACARTMAGRAGPMLAAEGLTGPYSVHPASDRFGDTYFVVLFEPKS